MNLSVLEESLIFSGSLFQSCGADTENAREPYDAKQNLSGCSWKAEDERIVVLDQIDRTVLVHSEFYS